MQTVERDRIAREFYDQLSARERRERFVLSPAYRSAYNRAIDSEDRMTLPRYFWRKWLPVLGAEPAALYVVLRDISQVEAKGSDSWCWPEQNELARRVGISRNYLRKCLGILESHGFIQCVRKRTPATKGWGMVQATNHYEVFLDIPLTPEASVELLLGEMAKCASAPEFISCTQGKGPVDNSLSSRPALSIPEFTACTQGREEVREVSCAEFMSCAPNVKNVDNVSNVRRSSFRDDPRVRALTPTERREREGLAQEIGDTLARMSGTRDDGPHRSLGLHRRFAYLMPTTLVKQALMATRDAVDEQRAGRKTLRGGPSVYFAGIAFALADQAGIELGVNRKGGARPVPSAQRIQGPKDPCVLGSKQGANKTPIQEHVPDDDERLRIREILRGAIRSWPKTDPAQAE